MSDISNIVQKYADGRIDFQEARDRMRIIEAAPYEHSNPYSNEWVEHEGGVVELSGACIAHKLTLGEHSVLNDELLGTEVDEGVLNDPAHQIRMGIPFTEPDAPEG